jgi:hypothetical protein
MAHSIARAIFVLWFFDAMAHRECWIGRDFQNAPTAVRARHAAERARVTALDLGRASLAFGVL